MDEDESKMQNVELHRADSMINPPIDLIKKENEKFDKRKTDIYSFVATGALNLLREIRSLKIEVIMFLYMFSYIIRSVSTTTMIMDKVCLVHLGYDEKVCSDLSEHKELKSLVEKMANNYHLGHSLLQMIPSAILSCFIGCWSDKYGRKPPIIIALLGIILDGLGSTICAAVLYSRVEFFYIPAIFSGISGGMIGVLTVLYSYASDVTTFGKRTMKYALMEMAFGIAMPLGSLAGGYIFKLYGYVPVFLTSTAGHVLGLAWALFVLQETKGLDVKESWRAKFLSFWTMKSFVDGFKATIKKRPNKGKEQLLLLIAAMSFAVLTLASTGSIGFLYVHHLYDWDNTTYSTVSAVFAVTGMIVMLISVPVFKKLNLGDAALGIAGSISMMLKNVGTGLAERKGVYFLANLLGLMSSLSTLAGRSRISKVVSKDDLGKVFSFLTTAEAVLPIAASAVVSQAFNASLDLYPGLVYLVLGGLMGIPVAVFLWLACLPKVDYEEMHNNSQEEDTQEDVAEKPPKV